jgi:GT2 family glycosyltransferase
MLGERGVERTTISSDWERTPMKLVYIIVLNWNGWRDTLACIASLLELEYRDTKLLIVDNGSTDESVPRIREAYPFVEILENGINLGFGGGCNRGIRVALARGAEYIWLINSDATVAPEALTALVQMADRDSSLGCVGSVALEAEDKAKIQFFGGGCVNLWLGRSVHRVAPGAIDFVSGASALYLRGALEQVGLFDEDLFFMYWEDTDLGFRLRKAGWRLAVAEGSRIWHKQSASLGVGNPLLDEYATCSSTRFLRRHAPVPRISIFLMLVRMLAKRLLMGRLDRFLGVLRGYRNA